MIIKYKVSDLAKDTGMSNKDVLAVLSTLDGDKKHASQLTEEELDFFFNSVTLNNQVKSLDAYFSMPEEPKKEEPVKVPQKEQQVQKKGQDQKQPQQQK